MLTEKWWWWENLVDFEVTLGGGRASIGIKIRSVHINSPGGGNGQYNSISNISFFDFHQINLKPTLTMYAAVSEYLFYFFNIF
jgi:hypothetical protein